MKKLITFKLLLFIILGFSNQAYAQFYWVGDGGNWSDFEHHWATTSGGTTFHTAAPTNDDDVFFDENSFSKVDQTVIFDDYAKSRNMSWNVNYSPTFYGRSNLYIQGDATFQANMTYDVKYIGFLINNKEITITSNGANLGEESEFVFLGNGVFNLADDLTAKQVRISGGTFNTNSHDINLSGYFIISNGEINLNLGNSYITCSTWRVQNSTYNLDAGTSTISTTTFEDKIENNQRTPYNKVLFKNYGIVRTAANIKEVIVDVTKSNAFLKFYGDSKLVCESLTATTDKQHPLELGLFTGDNFATIEQVSGTVNLNYVNMQDIHAIGGATFNAIGSDNGNNDGWNFSPIPSDNYYWVGDSGEWEDTEHWAKTSGGSEKYTTPPTLYDNVFLDINSFSMDTQQITITENPIVNDIICENVQHNPTLLKTNGIFTVKGNVNFVGAQVTMLNFKVVTNTLSSLNFGTQCRKLNVILEGGTFDITGDLHCDNFYFQHGTLNCNNHQLQMNGNFSLQGNSTINLGSSNIDVRDLRLNLTFGDLQINAGTSKITCHQYFVGGNQTYNHVMLEKKAIVYGDNTFNTLEFAAGAEVQLDTGKVQTILGDIIFHSTSDKNIHISSTSSGTPSTIFKADGTVTGNYLVLQDNIATGGATFTANQSIDLGNNTGWNITELMPRDFYWIGNGGNWSDVSHWATTSGGNTLHNDIPGLLDNVYFDENSFASSEQSVFSENDISINTLDWTSTTNQPKFTGTTINIYEDLIGDQALTFSFENYNILGSSEHKLDLENVISNNPTITIETDGKVELMSNLMTNDIHFKKGEFNTNHHDVHIMRSTIFSTNSPKKLNLGTSNFESKNINWSPNGDSLFIHGENATMICETKFLLNTYQAGEHIIEINLQHLRFNNPDNICQIDAKFHADSVTIEPGKEISINPNSDFSVGQLMVVGTEDNPIKMHGKDENVAATIKQTSGIVDGQYLELKDLVGAGGANFYAHHSTNLGNVTGWNFSPVITKNINDVKEISIVPNPVFETIFIDLPNTKSGQYEIYNALGKQIIKHKFNEIGNKLLVDVKEYDSGIYFILILAENDIFQAKFIKK